MKKTTKKNKKVTNFVLLKSKTELFELQEFDDFMNMTHPNRDEIREDVEYPTEKFPLSKLKKNVVSVPYVFKSKDKHKPKEVEIAYFKSKTKIQTTTEKEWIEKSLNQFFYCVIRRSTFVVEENSDKFKISLFQFSKKRSVGHKYFSKVSDDIHITFNKKTKNFFITTSTFFNRRRKTHTFKNSFKHLIDVIMTLEVTDLSKTFMKDLHKIIYDKLQVTLGNTKEGLGKALACMIAEWFIKVRKIGVPNNYFEYLVRHYPGIRKLKKFKMNLGRTILHEKGLVGKAYIKLINEGEYNLTDIKKLENIFGKKYFTLLPKKFLKETNDSIDSRYSQIHDGAFKKQTHLTKYEKLNLIKVLSTLDDNQSTTFISLIVDHIRIQGQLWSFNDKVRIKAKTLSQFNNEHAEWSNLIHLYERNDSTQYIYDESFIKVMEKPLLQSEKEFEVKILKNDLDYFEEGQTQKHCVRTYLGNHSSIIMSIREKTNTMNRMTCEFKHETPQSHDDLDLSRLKDYNLPRGVQSRLKYNVLPIEETWKELNKKINKRFVNYCNTHKLNRPKIEVYNKINGNKRVVDWENNGIEVFDFVGNDLPF
tara:strand:- start:271 stop:2040 length:1770 start_codon:yes stop_codon:yes gene_type:complete